MLKPLPWQNFIFDLDGTLVDSLPGIEASIRHALAANGLDRPLPDLRAFVGPPIASMLPKLWPDLGEDQLAAMLATFRHHYDTEGCLCSPPFPGVGTTLKTLHAQSLRLFVLTNKPLKPATRLLAHFDLRDVFEDIVSPDSVTPSYARKRDGAALLITRHRLEPARTLIMGDGLDDLEAAAAHGFGFVSATYGYGSAARSEDSTILARAARFSDIEYLALSPASTSL